MSENLKAFSKGMKEKLVVLKNYKYNKINNKLTLIHKESFAYKKDLPKKACLNIVKIF